MIKLQAFAGYLLCGAVCMNFVLRNAHTYVQILRMIREMHQSDRVDGYGRLPNIQLNPSAIVRP